MEGQVLSPARVRRIARDVAQYGDPARTLRGRAAVTAAVGVGLYENHVFGAYPTTTNICPIVGMRVV